MTPPKLCLCSDLRPIYDHELTAGNFVSSITAPAGTKCAYAVTFAEPLTFVDSPAAEFLPSYIQYWECRDPYHDLEAGYFCSKHRHSVAGPLRDE